MSNEFLSGRDLVRHLDAQIAAMHAVLAALEAEQQALRQRDADALLQAVNTKAASLARADELEKQRHAVMRNMGVSENSGIEERWQQVLALTRRCRAINESNGQFIRGQRRRVDATLQLLRGGFTSVTEYGPGGEGRPRSASRTLASY